MMFVAGGKLINFDSVDYVDLYTGENACVYFYHRDTGTHQLVLDDLATEEIRKLAERVRKHVEIQFDREELGLQLDQAHLKEHD